MEDWKKIEALLFASGKYLTEEQLINLSKIPKNKIKKVLQTLKKKYEVADTSLAVYNEVDSWKLNVKEEYTEVIREVVSEAEMPRAVMETLAIIAYKSPVLQSEIKDIRGTTVYDHIPLLEAKGFIIREKHGRSYKIKLTNKFHEYFDIEGDAKLAELFKDVKKPDIKKLGSLDVYTAEENGDVAFQEKIIERMKKLEKKTTDQEEENNFLNKFEEKFTKTKQKIDESEQDIATFRKKSDKDTEEIFKEKPKTANTEEQTQKEIKDENFEESEESTDAVEEKQDDDEQEETKESLIDEKGEPVPDFIEKINKKINKLVKEKK